jgi:hypothetical protein
VVLVVAVPATQGEMAALVVERTVVAVRQPQPKAWLMRRSLVRLYTGMQVAVLQAVETAQVVAVEHSQQAKTAPRRKRGTAEKEFLLTSSVLELRLSTGLEAEAHQAPPHCLRD